jgi:hypothetical protein
MASLSDITSYVPGSQYIIEAIGQNPGTGEAMNEYSKYVDVLQQPVQDTVAVVTSWGGKYKMAFEDLKTGNFSKAIKLFESIGTNPAYNMVPPGLKNKSAEYFYYAKPTEDDYIQGTFRRYFLQDVRNGEIKEITSETYKSIIDKGYYRRTKLEWNLLGPSEDETVNGYIYPGAVARNRDVVIQAEEVIPGITEFLSDLRQFVVEDSSKFKLLKKEKKEVTTIEKEGVNVVSSTTKKIFEEEELPPLPELPQSEANAGEVAANEGTQSADSTSAYAKSLTWYQAQVGNPSAERSCGSFTPVSMKLYNQEGPLLDDQGNPKKDIVYYRTKNAAPGNIYQPIRRIPSFNEKIQTQESYELYYTIRVEGYGDYTAKIDRQGKLYDIKQC